MQNSLRNILLGVVFYLGWSACSSSSVADTANPLQVEVKIALASDSILEYDPLLVRMAITNTGNSVLRIERNEQSGEVPASFQIKELSSNKSWNCRPGEYFCVSRSRNDDFELPAGGRYIRHLIFFKSGTYSHQFESAGNYTIQVDVSINGELVSSPAYLIRVKPRDQRIKRFLDILNGSIYPLITNKSMFDKLAYNKEASFRATLPAISEKDIPKLAEALAPSELQRILEWQMLVYDVRSQTQPKGLDDALSRLRTKQVLYDPVTRDFITLNLTRELIRMEEWDKAAATLDRVQGVSGTVEEYRWRISLKPPRGGL